jgi:hypothetical protein
MLFMIGFVAAGALWMYTRLNAAPDEERVLIVGMKMTRPELFLIGVFVIAFAVIGALTAIYEEAPLQMPFAIVFFLVGVWIMRRARTDPAVE